MLSTDLTPDDGRKKDGRVLIRGAVILLVVLGLAAAWRWTPLADWVDFDTIIGWATSLKGNPAAPFIVAAAYVVGSLVLVPVTLLTVATVFTFGPIRGYAYAVFGCLLSAALTYGIGHMLGHDVVRRIGGSRLDRLNQSAARHGLVTVVTIRMLPIAPFTIVNMIIGASRIRFRDFILGTFLGMAPGLLALTLFEYQLENAVRGPGIGRFAILAVLVVLVILGSVWIHRRLANSHGSAAAESFSERRKGG